MKVLVVGAAGSVGRRVAAELAQSDEVEELIVTARDPAGADRVASMLGPGTTGEGLDVHDVDRFISLAGRADVVVCAAGPYYLLETDAVRAAIDAKTHYISLCDDQTEVDAVLALDGEAKDAGVTVVSGCGVSPGLTNLLISVGAEEIDEVEEIDIAVAASSADTSGEASTLHFLHQMASPAPWISDGSTDEVRAGTSPRLIYFPDPVGWVETFRSGHPEIMTMPRTYPGLRSLRFRIGLTERAAMDVVRGAAAARLLGSEQQRRLWLRMSEPLRPVVEALPPRGAAWTAARVDVRGHYDGKPTTVSLAVVDHLANLAAVPLAHAALELARGGADSGVRGPEKAFDARSFLKAIAERGIRIARLDPATV